ncbi:MAG: secondary thiamine-phosphate synthase enzyme YjbQ [Candidatus Bipolaricaulota bacterium]
MSPERHVEVSLRTAGKEQVLDVSSELNRRLPEIGVEDGAVLVYCPHTTAAITVNESADPDVSADITQGLAAMVPGIRFRHAEGNSPAHLRAALLGPSLVLPVQHGKLKLGTWQGIYFCEFDGPRSRSLWLFPLGSVSAPGR